jgi:uncharacterized membrane protein YccC
MAESDHRRFGLSALGGLTDDFLTLEPRARSVRAYFREAIDRLLGADPGLTQLRMALQAVLGVGAGVGLAYLFVRITGALQLSASAGPPAVVSATNHVLLIVAMLLSAIVAMMAGFVVTDASARGQVLSTLLLPIPMLAAIAIGLALGPYRVLSLVWLVILMALAVYVRRFGPRGSAAGLVAFNGGFLGFFLHAEIGIGDLGWLAASLGVGVVASLIVRFTLFRPNLAGTLERMRRSWEARGRRLIALSVAVLEDGSSSGTQLQRQLVRLNESTLMIDAQLADAVPASAEIEAQRLFDAELALSNIARFANGLAILDADGELRSPARECLKAILREDRDEALARADELAKSSSGDVRTDDPRTITLAHRFAASVRDYLTACEKLYAVIADREEGRITTFVPAVTLTSGFLPGSVPVSTAASTTPGRGLLDRSTMPPYVRSAIQVAVAASIAITVGDIVSGKRLYWALLATFLAFMATTNSGEQVRKALFRVTGTAIGVVLGDLLVHVTGGHVWSSLVIVVLSLFFGIYLIRINYTFMVIGITVTVSQLYAQLDEFSWRLLLLRLGETAIGVGAVVLTVLVIVPLRPQRVLTVGVKLWFSALTQLLDESLDRLLGGEHMSLRPAVRQLDAAYQALEATAIPLRRGMFGRNSQQLAEFRAVSAAAGSYARSLAVGVEDSSQVVLLSDAARQLRASAAAIDRRLESGAHGSYVRSASLVELAMRGLPEGETPERLALRDLTLIDGALARLATALQMDVLDHDASSDPIRTMSGQS